MKNICCDYLVVGGGATGFAFVDELIHNSENLTVVMVDRFVKLSLIGEKLSILTMFFTINLFLWKL